MAISPADSDVCATALLDENKQNKKMAEESRIFFI
jgi:hypothetical protein